MKLQNEQTKDKIVIINIMLLIIFFTSLIFSYINIEFLGNKDELVSLVSFLLLLYMAYLGCPYFRYDSKGETLIFQNRRALPFSFLIREIQSDFPKGKLVRFKVYKKPLFKKNLEIYISSKRVNTGITKVQFDISYLNAKELKDISISLNKVVNDNAKYYNKKEKEQEQIIG